MDTCIFCKIINKEIPSYVVYENDTVIAILNRNMEVYGHTLVIPKKHYQDIYDIPEDVLSEIIKATKTLALRYKEKIGATGINLWHASGVDAQQSVFHFHMHILPRFENDGLDTRPKLTKIDVDKDILLQKIKMVD